MAHPADLPWEELHGNLRAFIARRVRNPADVEDLVQRVLLRLVRGLGSLRDVSRLHAWVYQTARHAIVDHHRAAPPRREVAVGSAADVDTTVPLAGSSPAGDEDEAQALRELARCLQPMIHRLPPEYRDAIVRIDLEGMPQSAAAREAGVSLSGMKSRVQRGRRQLKTMLELCCRVELDRRHGIVDYEPRVSSACGCGSPADAATGACGAAPFRTATDVSTK
jgi:RNA polymerase sigma-70 factor (ECF subfamily)